jgi:putative salt-induced outer membrane protein
MRPVRYLFAVSAALLLGRSGRAEAQAADTTHHELKGSVDLGLVAASGNTDLLTFTFGEKLEYTAGRWTVTQGAKMVNGTTDGVETANNYMVYVRPDYDLSERWHGYLLGSWDRDPFLGVATRWQEGIGVSYAAIKGPAHSLSLDGGFAFFEQEFTNGVSTTFPTARGQVLYKYNFTPKAYLQELFVYLPNLEDGKDYRINNEVSLVAPVAGRLALKATYLLQYQNAPQPGFGTTDNLYTTGLQVTF